MSISILVLGFYDRKNLGDESYKHAFPRLLGDFYGDTRVNIQFKCTDDIDKLPSDIDVVICGGGDIINNYFMNKTRTLLQNYKGRVYAVSVGIPYNDKVATNYLQMFDHVWVRSQSDYDIAVQEIGDKNVSLCGDISLCLTSSEGISQKNRIKRLKSVKSKMNIGVCLAHPALFKNPQREVLLTSICDALKRVCNRLQRNVCFYIIPFNTNITNERECDIYLNHELQSIMLSKGLECVTWMDADPLVVMEKISNDMDAMVCMRYHSVMFSIIGNTPFVTLHTTKKIDSLLKDVGCIKQGGKMTCDSYGIPYGFDVESFESRLLEILIDGGKLNTLYTNYKQIKMEQIPLITKTIIGDKLIKTPIDRQHVSSFIDVLKLCERMLPSYLDISSDEYNIILMGKGVLPHNNKKSIDIARFICYIITRKTHHSTLWGLMQNMDTPQFCLYDAIKYIWNEYKSKSKNDETITYFPRLSGSEGRNVLLDVDNIFNRDFADVHRSGWNYVVAGLLALDSSQYLRGTGDVIIDTYVDRTFHWGFDTISTFGFVPYTKPWIGFIHHTFDTTHSSYNCEVLFSNPHFIDSLQNCKGLIALSLYLAKQLQERLIVLGLNIPVHNVCHPTEFVEQLFTPQKFLDNPNRSVVQIGAWLRNPYSLFEVKVRKSRKVALKGSEMDIYFAPPNYLSNMASILLTSQTVCKSSDGLMCRDSICRDNTLNKFCAGIYSMLEMQYDSVYIAEKLTNEEYDTLLSENIVFLNLVDCSAVNTVIECIVRNTVLIVNRLPALEEVLGTKYPGFYNTLEEAATLCDSDVSLFEIYQYLVNLDKTRFSLDRFMTMVQQIANYQDIQTIDIEQTAVTEPTVDETEETIPSFLKKYPNLARFLPKRFRI